MHLARRLELGRARQRNDPLATGDAGRYGVISLDPPVLLVNYWYGTYAMMRSMGRLYDALADRDACLLVLATWWMGAPESVAEMVTYDRTHRKRYPRHTLIHLCNTPEECERFTAAGLTAHFVSQHCLIDERIFRPLDKPLDERPLEAVYDARLTPFKRHELTDRIERLGLIYFGDHVRAEAGDLSAPLHRLAHRHLFNDPDGRGYRTLEPQEVNAALNRCRVGLALSAIEGAMWACGQYLLAGLPVVSTLSRGGRDLLFDDRVSLIVEPHAEAVAAGVRTMIERRIDPEVVRTVTLNKIRPHRERLIALIQEAYARAGARRRVEDDWHAFFCHGLFKYRLMHRPVIDALRRVWAGIVDPVAELPALRDADRRMHVDERNVSGPRRDTLA
jgi:hypothetical protein